MVAKKKIVLVVLVAVLSGTIQAQIKKSNLSSRIKLVDTSGKPVKCAVFKKTQNGRIDLGETVDGEVDIGKQCLTGEVFEFSPNDPSYNGTSKRCCLTEQIVCIYTKKQIETLVFNAHLYLADSKNKKNLAISAMSHLELAGIYQNSEGKASDSLTRQVYVLTGKWLDIKEPALFYSDKTLTVSQDLLEKLNQFQQAQTLKYNYIESNTLSKMAGVETWSVYSQKLNLK